MGTRAEPITVRPRPDDQMNALFADGWPAFITADREVKRHIGAVRSLFADLELVLLDVDDVIVASGWGVPLRWDGEPANLPGGYTDAMSRAVTGRTAGEVPDTFVIMAAQVHPDRRGHGLAGELLTALVQLAEDRHWTRVIAPVRPTLKDRYPLTPIESFATWTREDGAPLDPWIRTHWRLGARIIGTAPRSQTMTGSLAEWEAWTGMRLPEPGDYVIPDGLSALHIEQDAATGTYVEPTVWLQHR